MPMFYMMVGLPGSGKSFTAESIPNAVVHSSDAIRAEVLGDENDQTQQDLVFQTLHKRVLQDLVDGKDVVIYATPIITQDISYNTRDLVIDLGNSVPHPDRLNCPYVNRIGQLTVSILLNRFAKKESVYFTQKPIPLPHEIFKDGENNSNLERS